MRRLVFLAAATLFVSAGGDVTAQSQEFNTGKNLEIQYNILKVLQNNYVDTIKIDNLVLKGINSML